MNKLIRAILLGGAVIVAASADDCSGVPTSQQIEQQKQETTMIDMVNAVSIPAIRNYQEKRNLKRLYELRDQTTLRTYTYLQSEYTGRLVFLCDSNGYGIPYSTQYTAPEQANQAYREGPNQPQAEPNGLYPPGSANGTWIICFDPQGRETTPMYVEPNVVVTTFKLPKTVANYGTE